MDMLSKIRAWAEKETGIRALILVGSRTGGGQPDALSDYDLSVFGDPLDFIMQDDWLDEIAPHLICIHERFAWGEWEVPTRLTIFEDLTKVDFAFHPLVLLNTMIRDKVLSETYDSGYEVLLDKDKIGKNLPRPAFQAYRILRPSQKQFQQAVDEFWFEAYHVAKYLFRQDLWVAASRQHAMKKWLLNMLEWNAAIHKQFQLRAKPEGKNLKDWILPEHARRLPDCFGGWHFGSQRSALIAAVELFGTLSRENADLLNYSYNEQAEKGIRNFIEQLIFIQDEHKAT